ncbi:hypothetical protein ElyMa_006589100 [Elysia marginata]|uniref:C-type lectin domain-containing protein n=1 Tax=Elysia marginata TaxID=1093978 RepID=A0AAV4ICJ6_9GAST|nr:hypothetical protein ElyMa_006589100 [Elysia marginata]
MFENYTILTCKANDNEHLVHSTAANIDSVSVNVGDIRKFKPMKSHTSRMLSLPIHFREQASTLSECAAKCRQHPLDCLSFVYNKDDGQCLLGAWTVESGKMHTHACIHHENAAKYPFQRRVAAAGRLYTSACCKGEFFLRTLKGTQSKCLFYPNRHASFDGAKADCENRGSRMITFKTTEEATFVQNLLGCMDDTWVGIKDNCDNPGIDCNKHPQSRSFLWPDGTELSDDVKAVIRKNNSKYISIYLGVLTVCNIGSDYSHHL